MREWKKSKRETRISSWCMCIGLFLLVVCLLPITVPLILSNVSLLLQRDHYHTIKLPVLANWERQTSTTTFSRYTAGTYQSFPWTTHFVNVVDPQTGERCGVYVSAATAQRANEGKSLPFFYNPDVPVSYPAAGRRIIHADGWPSWWATVGWGLLDGSLVVAFLKSLRALGREQPAKRKGKAQSNKTPVKANAG